LVICSEIRLPNGVLQRDPTAPWCFYGVIRPPLVVYVKIQPTNGQLVVLFIKLKEVPTISLRHHQLHSTISATTNSNEFPVTISVSVANQGTNSSFHKLHLELP
jgi:ACR3 family arsenite efflux pump ArsB